DKTQGAEGTMAKRVTCKDCYFHENMLCALRLQEPCTTFRPAERNLEPDRQLSFVFRTERTRTAYAFPEAGWQVAGGGGRG
ncbi:MAG TPA: hypothetical protein VGI69_04385, partial [Gaiellaceae bacterium]